jgi:hypothetical protein
VPLDEFFRMKLFGSRLSNRQLHHKLRKLSLSGIHFDVTTVRFDNIVTQRQT